MYTGNHRRPNGVLLHGYEAMACAWMRIVVYGCMRLCVAVYACLWVDTRANKCKCER